MNKERTNPEQDTSKKPVQPVKQEETRPRSSAFNEPGPENEKSTMNSEEADLEGNPEPARPNQE